MGDLIGPNIQNSLFAHIVHVLLIGGVAVYTWQAISALVRKPTSVWKAVRKALNGAWLAVLFMVLTQPNPIPYLRVAGGIAVILIALSVFDKITSPGKRDELLTSGPADAYGREAENSPAAVGVRRD